MEIFYLSAVRMDQYHRQFPRLCHSQHRLHAARASSLIITHGHQAISVFYHVGSALPIPLGAHDLAAHYKLVAVFLQMAQTLLTLRVPSFVMARKRVDQHDLQLLVLFPPAHFQQDLAGP